MPTHHKFIQIVFLLGTPEFLSILWICFHFYHCVKPQPEEMNSITHLAVLASLLLCVFNLTVSDNAHKHKSIANVNRYTLAL